MSKLELSDTLGADSRFLLLGILSTGTAFLLNKIFGLSVMYLPVNQFYPDIVSSIV